MEIWEQRVESSGVRDKARSVRELVDLGGTSSDEEQAHLDRVGRVADLVDWVCTNVDPSLIAAPALAQLAASLDQVIQLLPRWRSGEGPELLTVHLLAAGDTVLASLASIPVPPTAPEAIVEIGSLRRSVGQHRGQVERELEGVLERAPIGL